MRGEYDAFTEEVLPPPSSIDFDPEDPEPGVRRDYQVLEGRLDLVERETPDAPRRRRDQPNARVDRAEDLLDRRGQTDVKQSLPGMEWTTDADMEDEFGLDVVEAFQT